jgi:acetoacetate decarboxylase
VIFPSIIKNAPPDVQQLISVPHGSDTKELHSGKGTLVFQSSNLDPLGEIPIVQIMKSEYSVSDLVLDYGEVLFDYLKEISPAEKQ